MRDVHIVLGVAVLASNLLAGVWGAVAWVRREPSVAFWYLLRAAQGLVIAQVGLGLALLAGGSRPTDGLHVVYGVAPLVVTLATEAMRVGAAERELEGIEDIEALERREQAALARSVVRRETGVMTIGTLLIVTLSLRALATGL